MRLSFNAVSMDKPMEKCVCERVSEREGLCKGMYVRVC